MRLESQLSRMNCQMFSTGLSSGDFGGSGIRVMLSGMVELLREVPAGLIEQQHGVGTGRHRLGDFRQVQGHRVGVAARQDQAGGGASGRADRAEDVGRARALVVRRRGPCAAPRPAPGDLVLLADPGLVLEPDLYRLARRRRAPAISSRLAGKFF